MRDLLQRRTFWVMVVAVLVPFGWLVLLVRLVMRVAEKWDREFGREVGEAPPPGRAPSPPTGDAMTARRREGQQAPCHDSRAAQTAEPTSGGMRPEQAPGRAQRVPGALPARDLGI